MTSLTRFRRLGVDLEKRVIFAFGSVDSDFCWDLVTALYSLAQPNRGRITIILNCDGGDEYLGWACVDAIRAVSEMCEEVVVVGTGQVMSMGAAIFMAAPRRFLTENTRFMVHGGEMVFDGPSVHHTVMLALGEEQKKNGARYASFLMENLNVPQPLSEGEKEKHEKFCLGESYLSAQEAVEYGFAHAVLSPEEYSQWFGL